MKNIENYIGRLARESLIHFLLIGALIFAFYGMTRDVSSEKPNRIVVTSGQKQILAAGFQRTWMRQPTEKEMQALVENHVREEVFYQEALAMGLDQDDPLVRRRMRMKLEFLLEDLASQDVDDETLVEYLEENPDKFRSELQLSFQQVYLNPGKRKDLDGDAKQMLASLNSGASPDTLGDTTMISNQFELETQGGIARHFGDDFAKSVIELAPGGWAGPIQSEYGLHLVKVSHRVESQQPVLVDIRELVKREYLTELTSKQKDLAYQQLRKNYEITIESAEEGQNDGSEIVATAEASEK